MPVGKRMREKLGKSQPLEAAQSCWWSCACCWHSALLPPTGADPSTFCTKHVVESRRSSEAAPSSWLQLFADGSLYVPLKEKPFSGTVGDASPPLIFGGDGKRIHCSSGFCCGGGTWCSCSHSRHTFFSSLGVAKQENMLRTSKPCQLLCVTCSFSQL